MPPGTRFEERAVESWPRGRLRSSTKVAQKRDRPAIDDENRDKSGAVHFVLLFVLLSGLGSPPFGTLVEFEQKCVFANNHAGFLNA